MNCKCSHPKLKHSGPANAGLCLTGTCRCYKFQEPILLEVCEVVEYPSVVLPNRKVAKASKQGVIYCASNQSWG